MCGIAGFVAREALDPLAQRHVARMCDAIAHRGPDSHAVATHAGCVLGHRRLAIIDLSPLGAQPMRSDDGALSVVFNGEIYNFLELRQSLEQSGHRFRSRSDTEVLLASYREDDVGGLARLRGMFAFALWDAPRRRLFAARDRLGKKPFYYAVTDQGLAFASELQGLLAHPGIRGSIDSTAIHDYLTYGYVPGERCAFAGVRKLPPGCYLTYDQGRLQVTRYWRLPYEPKLTLSEPEAEEAVLAELREAVRLRLISDVPVGAFLSGGVDSSLVVALMAERGAVRTFSIGFGHAEYDERSHARIVARHCGTTHEEFVVEPEAVAILPQLVRHYGEPFADSSAIPTWYLSQLTRRSVTVALNGDGGDESFAGYERYAAAMMAARFGWIPPAMLRGPSALVHRVSRHATKGSVLSRVDRFLEALGGDPRLAYARWVTYFSNDQKRELYTPEFAAAVAGRDSVDELIGAYDQSGAKHFLDGTLSADVQTYLPGDLLVKVDVATMAHGLEARSPLLDHQVVELAARIPPSYKMKGRATKRLLKRVAKRFLPVDVVDRPKMGFGVPLDHWLRHQLRDLSAECLLGERSRQRGYFQHAVVRRYLEEHWSGRGRWSHLLWNLVMLELWHREFIDRVATVDAGSATPENVAIR